MIIIIFYTDISSASYGACVCACVKFFAIFIDMSFWLGRYAIGDGRFIFGDILIIIVIVYEDFDFW